MSAVTTLKLSQHCGTIFGSSLTLALMNSASYIRDMEKFFVKILRG